MSQPPKTLWREHCRWMPDTYLLFISGMVLNQQHFIPGLHLQGHRECVHGDDTTHMDLKAHVCNGTKTVDSRVQPAHSLSHPLGELHFGRVLWSASPPFEADLLRPDGFLKVA